MSQFLKIKYYIFTIGSVFLEEFDPNKFFFFLELLKFLSEHLKNIHSKILHTIFKTNALYVFDVAVNYILNLIICYYHKEIKLILVIFNLNYSAFWNTFV